MITDRTALANALMFDKTYALLNREFEHGLETRAPEELALFVPVVVNCAFSCELFLKALLPVGTHGHDLEILFNKLNECSQSHIMNSIQSCVIQIIRDQNGTYTEADFQTNLHEDRLAFKEWRYFHEEHEDGEAPSVAFQFLVAFQAVLKGITAAEDQTQNNDG